MFSYPPWVSSSGPRQTGGTQSLDIQKDGHFDREKQLQSLYLQCIAILHSTIPSKAAGLFHSSLLTVGARDVFSR